MMACSHVRMGPDIFLIPKIIPFFFLSFFLFFLFLLLLDQSPITIRDTGTNDLSPWQHIDRIVT